MGDQVDLPGLGSERVIGLAEGPDDVGYPLAKPRVYLSRPAIDARFGRERNPQVNLAEIWLRNPAYINQVLVQARLCAAEWFEDRDRRAVAAGLTARDGAVQVPGEHRRQR